METILVVDDERNYTIVMRTLLEEQGYQVKTAQSGREALEIIEQNDLDLVLTDMTMPVMDGIELLEKVKADRPDLPVVMMTAYGTVEKAVQAMRKGAYDYITKPFKNEELMLTLKKALNMNRLQRENRELAQALKERYSFGNIIGKSKPMLKIYQLIEKVADTRANVLVTGESGTGKELIAKAVHYHSPRAQGPFLAVNCSALAESLLESELFGHEKGAFTDARQTRKGRFEAASGGTIFLDEIGEMSTNLQAKLLRVLQERTFERVGGNDPISVDVRVIAATNRDLKVEVAEGRFREDLYYRLNVVHIKVPPLRERKDDLPLLTAHFLKKFSHAEGNEKTVEILPDSLRFIHAYDWPGNVRELENALERAMILCSGNQIKPEDLPGEILEAISSNPAANIDDAESDGERDDSGPEQTAPPATDDLDIDRLLPRRIGLTEALETVEKIMIKRALEKAEQITAHAAEHLGITKNLMQYKMKKYPPDVLEAIKGDELDVEGAVPPDWDLNQVLENIEKKLLKRALEKSGGKLTQAAEELNITQRMIKYKKQKYNF